MSKSNSVGTQLTMNKKTIGSLKSIDGIRSVKVSFDFCGKPECEGQNF